MHQMARPEASGPGQGRVGALQPGRVLVATDEPDIGDRIVGCFPEHRCVALDSGASDLTRHLQHYAPSLVLLDVRHRPFDGFDLLQGIRARSDVPVIVIAGRHQDETDRVLALELGADDLVREPFNAREVLARARAILRRQEMGRRWSAGADRGGYRFEGWELRRSTRVLTNPDGGIVPLSRSDYALLVTFLESPRRPLSRLQLMRATRAHDDLHDRSIDVQVLRLRRKLEPAPDSPRLIRTERGVGYVLDALVERVF